MVIKIDAKYECFKVSVHEPLLYILHTFQTAIFFLFLLRVSTQITEESYYLNYATFLLLKSMIRNNNQLNWAWSSFWKAFINLGFRFALRNTKAIQYELIFWFDEQFLLYIFCIFINKSGTLCNKRLVQNWSEAISRLLDNVRLAFNSYILKQVYYKKWTNISHKISKKVRFHIIKNRYLNWTTDYSYTLVKS